jgi:hypothetical protein
MEPLHAKVARMTEELGLPESLSIDQAIQQANEQLGLEHAAGTSLVQQANAILADLGLGPEAPVDAKDAKVAAEPPNIVVGTVVATGKDSPPEHSSGTGAPPPTEGRVPAVPMRYRKSSKRELNRCNVFVCGSNVAAVVASLVVLWLHVIFKHNVTGTFVPPPSPPSPPQAPTSCPFDVVACNRQCALMHVDCQEGGGIFNATPTHQRRLAGKKKKKKRANCDALHGRETAKGSTANFTNFTDKRAHLESLDWEHEPLLWGLRKESIGDGTCDRSGCGATLCECNYDGGDCAEADCADHGGDIFRADHGGDCADLAILRIFLMTLAILIYLVTMRVILKDVVGFHLKAPKLRDEAELTAYVTKMQRTQLQVSITVVCSHRSGGGRSATSSATSTKTKSKTVVTHRSSHPFTYATSTDASTLTNNWQLQAGEGGRLGTGFVAVVSSGLVWSLAKGVTADKLKAEKERLHAENKHRDKDCSVRIKASLPGQLPDQLYAPAGAKLTKRIPFIAELLLVFLGLGAPLYFYYLHKLSRHVELTVRKTIYIEGHAPPAATSANV